MQKDVIFSLNYIPLLDKGSGTPILYRVSSNRHLLKIITNAFS
jgi:hypothetical protein